MLYPASAVSSCQSRCVVCADVERNRGCKTQRRSLRNRLGVQKSRIDAKRNQRKRRASSPGGSFEGWKTARQVGSKLAAPMLATRNRPSHTRDGNPMQMGCYSLGHPADNQFIRVPSISFVRRGRARRGGGGGGEGGGAGA